MSNVKVTAHTLEGDEDPHAVLRFGKDAVLKVTLNFDGDWLSLVDEPGGATEEMVRNEMARDFFLMLVEGLGLESGSDGTPA